MIIRKILILFITVLAVQASWAQEKQPSLGILKLDAPDIPQHKAVKINKYVESAFYKSRRFNIVTRQLLESIDQEREGQKENIDKLVIQQGRAIGADYIVKGSAKTYKSQIYRSSPKSRGPYQSSTRRATSKTSPRNPAKEDTKTPIPEKESKSKTVTKTSPVRTANSSKSSSPRGTSKVENTTRSKSTTKSTTKSQGQTSSTKKPKTSPLRNKSSNTKTSTAPPPLSAEIDRIYTSIHISFTVKIINVKTGVIAAEKTYKGSINGITAFVQKIVRETFPYEFNILEIMEKKGNKKAKHLLVDGGLIHGLKYGSLLKAYEVTEENVDGKILKREIMVGQLYVKKVDTGGHFSLCTIYKGKKEILAKMNAGVKLVLR